MVQFSNSSVASSNGIITAFINCGEDKLRPISLRSDKKTPCNLMISLSESRWIRVTSNGKMFLAVVKHYRQITQSDTATSYPITIVSLGMFMALLQLPKQKLLFNLRSTILQSPILSKKHIQPLNLIPVQKASNKRISQNIHILIINNTCIIQS